jgi:hypothetical protein
MTRLMVQKQIRPSKLMDELIAAIPALQPQGERAQVRVQADENGLNGLILTVPDVLLSQLQAVVDAHDPAAPAPNPDDSIPLAVRSWLADNAAEPSDLRRKM